MARGPDPPRRCLRELPKAHLHLHLEGAMRTITLSGLCERHGLPVPEVPTPDGDGTYDGFGPFKDLYLAAVDALRAPEDLQQVVAEIVEDASKDGARWLELHFYAGYEPYRKHLGPPQLVWELVRTAAAEAGRSWGVRVGFIAGVERWLPVEDSVETAQLAVRLKDLSHTAEGKPMAPIVALGLQGPEDGFPPEPFEEAFRIAREAGLPAVPHAGEEGGPASIRGALDVLGATRLAHGVRSVEDPELVKRLAAEAICCDVCPTSNVMLRVVKSLEAHPLPALIQAGVPCTINADDPLLFRSVSLLDEYTLLREKMEMSDEQVAAIARTSLSRSFCPDRALLDSCLEGVDAWLAAGRDGQPAPKAPRLDTVSGPSAFRFRAGTFGPSSLRSAPEVWAFTAEELPQLEQCFREFGFAVLRDARVTREMELDVVAADMTKQQQAIVEGAAENAKGGHGANLGAGGEARIGGRPFAHFVGGATARSTAACRAWRHPKVMEAVRQLLGAEAFCRDKEVEGGTIYQDSRAQEGTKYSRIGWHTDFQGTTTSYPDIFPMMSVTLHVDGTSPANGFLRIVPGSHHGGSFGLPRRFDYVEGEMALYCQPGDVLFHDYKLWHSAARATCDDDEAGARRHLRGLWYSGHKDCFPEGFDFDNEFNKNAAR